MAVNVLKNGGGLYNRHNDRTDTGCSFVNTMVTASDQAPPRGWKQRSSVIFF